MLCYALSLLIREIYIVSFIFSSIVIIVNQHIHIVHVSLSKQDFVRCDWLINTLETALVSYPQLSVIYYVTNSVQQRLKLGVVQPCHLVVVKHVPAAFKSSDSRLRQSVLPLAATGSKLGRADRSET